MSHIKAKLKRITDKSSDPQGLLKLEFDCHRVALPRPHFFSKGEDVISICSLSWKRPKAKYVTPLFETAAHWVIAATVVYEGAIWRADLIVTISPPAVGAIKEGGIEFFRGLYYIIDFTGKMKSAHRSGEVGGGKDVLLEKK